MKNISVFFCLVILALICSMPAFAQKAFFAVETGILYGTSFEIVYSDSSSRYLSELQWNIKPLWFAGIALGYGPGAERRSAAFFIEFDFKAGLPAITGNMEDRDWMSPSTLTHYSSHDNFSKTALLADLSAGHVIRLNGMLRLKSFAVFSYMYFNWDGRNGRTQYGNKINGVYHPYNDPNNSTSNLLSGTLINYRQHWIIPAAGIGLELSPGRFFIQASLAASPFVVCIDRDDHYLRTLLYEDFMSGGFFVEPKGSVLFAYNRFFSLGLSASYRYIGGVRGDTVFEFYDHPEPGYKKGERYRVKNASGAEFKAFKVSLVFKSAF